jgi:hypothetical protein
VRGIYAIYLKPKWLLIVFFMGRNVLILGAAIIFTFLLCSYKAGPAHHGGLDCTGAETGQGNPTGCSCHGNTPTSQITLAIEIDSAGDIPVTTYKGGLTYTVKITGTNTTNNNLRYFGFQLAAITGATPQVAPTNAGAWQQTGLPAGVQYSPTTTYYACNIIEHSTTLSPLSGTGGNGTVYTESITWTAPPAGTGTVSFWTALNGVTGVDMASPSDKWNTQHLVLPEAANDSIAAINEVADRISANIYPNPSTGHFEISGSKPMQHVEIFDITGRMVYARELNSDNVGIDLGEQGTGTYLMRLYSSNQSIIRKIIIIGK